MPSAFDTLKLLENPAFKSWFGRSKVVDESGAPRVVYHGSMSPESFDRFRRKPGDIGIHFGDEAAANDRLDFLSDVKETDPLGRNPRLRGDPRIYPTFLRAENPLRLEDAGQFNINNLLDPISHALKLDLRYSPYEKNWFMQHPNKSTAWLRDLLQERGYDSIVYKNSGEIPGGQSLRDNIQDLRAKFEEDRRLMLKGQKPIHGVHAGMLSDAENEYTRTRHTEGGDSYAVFDPRQVKSVFNTEWSPREPRFARGGLALARDYGR